MSDDMVGTQRVAAVVKAGEMTVGTPRWTATAQSAAKMRNDLSLMALDVAVVGAGYLLVLLLRFDANIPSPYWEGFRAYLPFALAIHLTTNAASGLYGQVWRHASVAEARKVLSATGGAFLARTSS